MKLKTISILAATAVMTASSHAALILTFSDVNADFSSGTASSGTFTNPTTTTDSGTAGSGGYPLTTVHSYLLTGLTIDGQGGYDLSFDMNVSAGGIDGVNIEDHWMVDAGNDGNVPGGDVFRINENETLTFSISNAVVSGGSVPATATFTGFTAFNDSAFENPTAHTENLAAGTFTGGSGNTGREGHRVTGVSFGMELTAVPEPSSTALLGLGGLALILRRRR